MEDKKQETKLAFEKCDQNQDINHETSLGWKVKVKILSLKLMEKFFTFHFPF